MPNGMQKVWWRDTHPREALLSTLCQARSLYLQAVSLSHFHASCRCTENDLGGPHPRMHGSSLYSLPVMLFLRVSTALTYALYQDLICGLV